jgi:hypothetical protein
MGSAKNSGTCASITFGQVAAVGEMALFIGTLGSSSAATGPQKASKLAKLKKDFKAMKAAFDKVKNTPRMAKAIDKAKKAGKITGAAARGFKSGRTLATATTEEDMIRAAAQIAAIADPTEVSSTVAPYTYPKCSKYFGKPGGSR